MPDGKLKAKEFLQQVAYAEREIRTIKAQIDHFMDLGLRITSSMSNTPISASRGSSRVETSAVGIVDGSESLNANLRAYEAKYEYAKKLVKRIPQERYRRLITLHYLCGWKLPRVGEELGYEDRNSVYRAHGWALVEMQKILDEEGNNGLQVDS